MEKIPTQNTETLVEKFTKDKETYKQQMASISISVMQHQYKAEEECVSLVLKEYLKRAPTDEDFSRCTRMFETENSKLEYILCHENVKLGLIKHEFTFHTGTPSFTVSFNPEVTEFQS